MARGHHKDVVQEASTGQAIASPTIQVETTSGTILSDALYAAATGAATRTNPFTGNANGTYEFYLSKPQRVQIRCTVAGRDPVTSIVDVDAPEFDEEVDVRDSDLWYSDGSHDDGLALAAAWTYAQSLGERGARILLPPNAVTYIGTNLTLTVTNANPSELNANKYLGLWGRGSSIIRPIDGITVTSPMLTIKTGGGHEQTAEITYIHFDAFRWTGGDLYPPTISDPVTDICLLDLNQFSLDGHLHHCSFRGKGVANGALLRLGAVCVAQITHNRFNGSTDVTNLAVPVVGTAMETYAHSYPTTTTISENNIQGFKYGFHTTHPEGVTSAGSLNQLDRNRIDECQYGISIRGVQTINWRIRDNRFETNINPLIHTPTERVDIYLGSEDPDYIHSDEDFWHQNVEVSGNYHSGLLTANHIAFQTNRAKSIHWEKNGVYGDTGGVVDPVTGIALKLQTTPQVKRFYMRNDPWTVSTLPTAIANGVGAESAYVLTLGVFAKSDWTAEQTSLDVPTDRLQLLAKRVITATDATYVFDFAGIPATGGGLRLELRLRGVKAVTTGSVYLLLNNDGGANYDSIYQVNYNTTAAAPVPSAGAVNATVGACPAGSAPAGEFGTLVIDIPDYAATDKRKSYLSQFGYKGADAVTDIFEGRGSGTWRSTAAITRVRVSLASDNNLAEGSTLALYRLP